MTVCIRRNVCSSITLDYMKNTNILIHERINIPVFHIMARKFMYISRCRCVCVSSGINIHVNIHMNMVIGLPRSINVNISISISISISINKSISISILHIRISLNISVISKIKLVFKTGISVSIQQIIDVSTSIGNNY